MDKPKLRRGTGHRTPNAADDAAEAARQKRRDEAWQLRTIEGLTHRQIAERLKVAPSTIEEDIKRAREEHKPADLEELRAKVDAEIQFALDGLRRAVKSGKSGSVMAQMKALERLCKLHGLDAPERHEVSATLGASPETARQAMQDVFGGNVLPTEPGKPGGGESGAPPGAAGE